MCYQKVMIRDNSKVIIRNRLINILKSPTVFSNDCLNMTDPSEPFLRMDLDPPTPWEILQFRLVNREVVILSLSKFLEDLQNKKEYLDTTINLYKDMYKCLLERISEPKEVITSYMNEIETLRKK
ncbi:hypothetical protein TetV_099 [Tetraselmis virus 1]|uniref:Uncharacterized protein n=1 Tax=Tetraselmis virus 1 TaxID=2060617 RepID=A0A2P0VMT5_9VIRU|nr:hypothetical protein QJ968_gp099 [Tetraselmis virus 1]AUF82191.1 hypothetical protein TetV_099 [Tetraselmis virus 1]